MEIHGNSTTNICHRDFVEQINCKTINGQFSWPCLVTGRYIPIISPYNHNPLNLIKPQFFPSVPLISYHKSSIESTNSLPRLQETRLQLTSDLLILGAALVQGVPKETAGRRMHSMERSKKCFFSLLLSFHIELQCIENDSKNLLLLITHILVLEMLWWHVCGMFLAEEGCQEAASRIWDGGKLEVPQIPPCSYRLILQ